MPGSSLWLVPPQGSALNKTLQSLISSTIPSHFPGVQTHNFIPHITITSNIDPTVYQHSPQAWLENLPLSTNKLLVRFEACEPGKPFFKKLTVRVKKEDVATDSLTKVAAICRAEGVEDRDMDRAREWAERDYLPHLSLMYADLEVSEVEKHNDDVRDDLEEARKEVTQDGTGDLVCQGGIIVLVPTDKPISEWQPIAELELPHVMWHWPSGL